MKKVISKQNFYIAFLRGINVGGNNKVSMKELKVCFEKQGYSNVTTYINSGNVIFSTNLDQAKLEKKIEESLLATFSIPITIVVRSVEEMAEVIKYIPLDWKDPEYKCDIIFIKADIDKPDIINEIKPKEGIEDLRYYPGILIWLVKRSNISKSNLPKIIGRKIFKSMTVRNPNSVNKIYDLMLKATNIH